MTPEWTPFKEVGRQPEKRLVYVNSRYQVIVRKVKPDVDEWPDLLWLSIKRLDQQPIREWRELQRIKNELVGPEFEGVELYPAESRKADNANQFHIFVLAGERGGKPLRFPFGFAERIVTEHPEKVIDGAKQEPFEDGDPWNTETIPDDARQRAEDIRRLGL